MLITCKTCRQEHLPALFVSDRGTAKNCAKCRDVMKAKFKKHYDANAKQVMVHIKRRRKANPEAYRKMKREARRRHAKKHPGVYRAKNRRYRKRYPEKNTASVNAYRARKLKATPGWARREDLDRIYSLAREQKALTGDNVHVDHIVPLKSSFVCGLHTPDNLRIVVGSYNSKKSNRTWPDMP
jgi:hypothetical protein